MRTTPESVSPDLIGYRVATRSVPMSAARSLNTIVASPTWRATVPGSSTVMTTGSRSVWCSQSAQPSGPSVMKHADASRSDTVWSTSATSGGPPHGRVLGEQATNVYTNSSRALVDLQSGRIVKEIA